MRKRRHGGGAFFQIVGASALTTTLAFLGFSSYQDASQKAVTRKAQVLVDQIETGKQRLRAAINAGECPGAIRRHCVADQILPTIRVQGVTLTGDPLTDAHRLGFAELNVGTLGTADEPAAPPPG